MSGSSSHAELAQEVAIRLALMERDHGERTRLIVAATAGMQEHEAVRFTGEVCGHLLRIIEVLVESHPLGEAFTIDVTAQYTVDDLVQRLERGETG